MEANPTMEDGTENIAYTILCEDWRYYCLENAPQFLDGYPNDGSVIVDPDELKVIDYNTTDTAKRYFQKLNEEYKKGYVILNHLHRLMMNILLNFLQDVCWEWSISGGTLHIM